MLVTRDYAVAAQHAMCRGDDRVLMLSNGVANIQHDPVARPAQAMRALGVREKSCVPPGPPPCVQDWQPPIARRIEPLRCDQRTLPSRRFLPVLASDIQ